MNSKRLLGIQKEISKIISQMMYEDIKNPKIKGLISVIKVKVTPDLKYSDIYVSVLLTEKEGKVETVIEGLNEIKGFLRKKVAENMSLRIVPALRFHLDDSIEHGIKISSILKTLK